MTRADRVVAAFAGVPEPCRDALKPLLRTLVHDLNGALSAMTMEAFTLDQLAARLDKDLRLDPTTQPGRQLEMLTSSASNLKIAAEGAASYLKRLDELADEVVEGARRG